jgi:hypothetical protein
VAVGCRLRSSQSGMAHYHALAAALQWYAATRCQFHSVCHCAVAPPFFLQNAALNWHSVMCAARLALLWHPLTCAACPAVPPWQLMAHASSHDVPAARRCLQPLLPLLVKGLARVTDAVVHFGLRVRCLDAPSEAGAGGFPGSCSFPPCPAEAWFHIGPVGIVICPCNVCGR